MLTRQSRHVNDSTVLLGAVLVGRPRSSTWPNWMAVRVLTHHTRAFGVDPE